ncbi:ABC transporter substrate-binding protein [Ornithinimicrobium sufpigmenti]|uniref:ABC transporter substrate-binding protein n=1 Tax=Ornithinimicrobium sufpigmenti TaxID=2508882 RepID=UPI001036ED45|nr:MULTISPECIES: ABC transporter substrate-binding protein [unclassified Ornithinimicrobium]
MRGRILVALAAAGSLMLAACGDSADDDTAGNTGGGGGDSEEYVVVWINPLSGASAAFGEASRGGVELALQDIAESGGINGSELEVLFEDNELQPEASITAYQRTAGRNPVTVMTAGSSVVLALAPLAEQDEVMLANIGAQSPALISPDLPQVYNFIPTSAAEADRLADRLVEDEGITKVATLSVDNDYGKDTSEAFHTAFEEAGGTISAREIHELGGTDMRTQLTKIKASDAEAVVFISNVGEVGHSVAQAEELGIDLPRYGFTYALSPDNFEIAGDAMDGMKGIAVSFVNDSEKALDFAERYEEAYGTWPNVTAAVSYDGTMIIAEGLREVGNDRQALIDYVANVEGHEGVLGTTNMTPERQSDFPLNEFEIVDGEIGTWE